MPADSGHEVTRCEHVEQPEFQGLEAGLGAIGDLEAHGFYRAATRELDQWRCSAARASRAAAGLMRQRSRQSTGPAVTFRSISNAGSQ